MTALACVVCWAGTSLAQSPARMHGAVTLGAQGLPALAYVAVPTPVSAPVTLVADAGYGFTEAMAEDSAGHQRLSGSFAAAVEPLSWLQIAAGLDGRYDWHDQDAQGFDDGATGLPLLAVRAFDATHPVAYGFETNVRFPGAKAPSLMPEALVLEAKLLGAYQLPSSPAVVAVNVGFRFDNGRQAVGDPDLYRRGDRVALGASEYHAVPIGLGAALPVGRVWTFADVSADLLLGARDLATVPIRAALGVRYALLDSVALEARGVAVLSKRPPLGAGSELIPIEPRIAALLGLRIALGGETPSAPVAKPIAVHEVRVAPSAPVIAVRDVTGVILDEASKPLNEVRVRLSHGEQQVEVITDDHGSYTIVGFPVGAAQRHIETADYQSIDDEVVVAMEAGELRLPALSLSPAVAGAQIRGLVQGFDGKPVRARLKLVPLGAQYESDAQGRFKMDVAPGTYSVEITAEGFVTQTRSVTVNEKAVVIVNADLRKSP